MLFQMSSFNKNSKIIIMYVDFNIEFASKWAPRT